MTVYRDKIPFNSCSLVWNPTGVVPDSPHQGVWELWHWGEIIATASEGNREGLIQYGIESGMYVLIPEDGNMEYENRGNR